MKGGGGQGAGPNANRARRKNDRPWQLAGGMAHDFNNILQAVGTYATVIDRNPAMTDVARVPARGILDSVERGGSICRRLLAFARRDALKAGPVNVGDLFANVRDLLVHALGPTITTEVACASSSLCVLADRGQLETVLLNLGTNARGRHACRRTPDDRRRNGEPRS